VIPAVRRLGSGSPLVCHPGGPGASSLYFGDLAGLGASFELILVDPRGTGATPDPADPRAYATEDYVADLEELRADLGLEEFDLLGHSHGGIVAIAYAAAFPGRVRRLVLASTLARFHAEQEAAMAEGMRRHEHEPWYADAVAALEAEQAGAFSTQEELAELTRREMPLYVSRYGDDERRYLRALEAEVWNEDALKLFNDESFTTFDLRPELARIVAPTLVVTGEDDFITGPVCARELAALVPGAELVVIPAAGHFVFVEARDRFRDEVERFLSA
jgi:proline-specific peptidase